MLNAVNPAMGEKLGNSTFSKLFHYSNICTGYFKLSNGESKAVTLNGSWGLLGGIRASYSINDDVSIELIAHGLIPNKLEKSYINKDGRDDMHLGYGGIEASYKY
jgi:hypothetical protein